MRAGRGLPQGICLRIPAAHHADKRPERSPANVRDIQLLLSDLEQVNPFRRHSGWWPEEIVRAEAAKRPGRKPLPPVPPAPGPERGPAAGSGDKPPAPPPPPEDIPTVRQPAPPPPD